MLSENYIVPEDFLFDITRIPGSNDEVARKAIEYYQNKLEEPDLPEPLKDIARAYVGNLTEYLEMADLSSPKLKEALPHFSALARFVEDRRGTDIDIEDSGRIKSFYSAYVKLSNLIFERIAKNQKLPQKHILKDIYATRDVLYPRHDMRFQPQSFYKLTYKFILDYMEYIDDLHTIDSRYSLTEISEKTRKSIEKQKPIKYTDKDNVIIPEKDFIDYCFEFKELPHGYRYLAEAYSNENPINLELLYFEINMLKRYDLSDTHNCLSLGIYNKIQTQIQRDLRYKLEDYFENILLSQLNKKGLENYSSYSLEEFMANTSLTTFQSDCCKFMQCLNQYEDLDTALLFTNLPEFKNKDFVEQLKKVLIQSNDEKNATLTQQLQEIQDIDLENYTSKFSQAQKIIYYSHCTKDYMRNPKSQGYQSFHIRINAPFGLYEKQIRTEEQHKHAENGPASHAKTYKPDIKNTFHRLKVSRPFSPKRDASGDIIQPTELGILPFDLSVQQFFGVSFSTFSGGKEFDEFISQFNSKEEMDQALLDLTPNENFITKLLNKVFKKPTIDFTYDKDANQSQVVVENIPQDIAVYQAPTLRPMGFFSTDDSDPHDNR